MSAAPDTAWGEVWLQSLVAAGTFDAATVARARGANARGAVTDVEIAPASVSASVRGRGPVERRVRVGVRRWNDAQWSTVREALAGSARWSAAVLGGALPPGLVEELAAAGVVVWPGAIDVSIDCSCGDASGDCSHAAAVCCHLAGVVDADPLVLVTLRGGDRARLVGDLAPSVAPRESVRRSAVVGRPDDPGMAASAAWRRRPGVAPSFDGRRRAVGRPRVGAHPPSPELGLTQAGLDRLVRDAAERAAAALAAVVSGAPEPAAELGLGLDASLDAVRRFAAGGLDARDVADVAGCPVELTGALAQAWSSWGAEGLEVLLRPRRLEPAEVAEVEAAFGGRVRERSTGALLDDGRHVRRSGTASWALVETGGGAGPHVAAVAPTADDLADL
ncbi:MAG: hypothetical protein U0Q22_04855 [Acidimicrobiales bacterium]